MSAIITAPQRAAGPRLTCRRCQAREDEAQLRTFTERVGLREFLRVECTDGTACEGRRQTA